jgi:aspartate/methionine/tyrosine aminotransferase
MSEKQFQSAPQMAARRVAQSRPSLMAGLVVRARELKTRGHNIVDLSAGVPDYKAPEFLVNAGVDALRGDSNSYGDSRGVASLRQALAQRFTAQQGVEFDADAEVTITAGATAALNATLLALVNPGDGVAFFEPFFEFFLPQIRLAGGRPKFIPLRAPQWTFRDADLKRALLGATRFLILNTPHNPTGRVFTAEELERIAFYCRQHNIIVLSDETYEPFVYGTQHLSIAALPGMKERTVTIGSVSKVFNVAGWRIGSILAPAYLTAAIRRVSGMDAPVPLQIACAQAMPHYQSFIDGLVADHQLLRNRLTAALRQFGMEPLLPEGTLSIWADIAALGYASDVVACDALLDEHGILAVPGSAFYRPSIDCHHLRFSFARKADTIEEACRRLSSVNG